MAANCDDHTKNMSFVLRERGRWELAPAYDITHAYNPKGEWTYQHLMAVNGKFGGNGNEITRADLLRVADRYAIGPAPKIIGQVAEALENWPRFAGVAGLSATAIQFIAADFRRL